MSGSAFTLIELLIVVAIIGILAAIAIPNFQAARIRAQVARVKADLRSIAVACDSYRIDEGRFPTKYRRYFFNTLTTPISYLTGDGTSDPFATHEERWDYKQYHVYTFDVLDGDVITGDGTESDVTDGGYPGLSNKKSVVVNSYGPDRADSRFYSVYRLGWKFGADTLSRSYGRSIYMSSNGLRSAGDIGRIIGDIPPGLPASIGG